ncbi:MAG: ROK family protein [Bacillota bacterium]|uniref:Glucokinase n=1 Tax=Thermanaerosceptrum fracticalcis TaxID=1712410 RepID=A0A7G6DYT6_THEFR|nr:ROK family protein [Thermanaerosceptrum fracticalcis]QNB44990.1 ROK family glucokinase [Thermanaerosceptrum fracticalcis]
MEKYTVGIDLGGTNITAALVNQAGEVKGCLKLATQAEMGPPGVTQRMIQMVCSLLTENNLTLGNLFGLGIGVPGLVNSREGTAIFLPNLPGWRNIPLVQWVRGELGVPVLIDNDVRMAAWGEKLQGAGRGWDDIVCITLGTGIGSGIFLQGKMFRGHSESAGEIGHMTVEKDGLPCTCGNRGCLEMYASGRAIARRAKEAVKQNGFSPILELAEGDESMITARTVYDAARLGDSLAHGIIREAAAYLGIGLANVANILNPQGIIIGGGVAGMGEMLLTPVREVVKARAMPLNREVEIVAAELGDGAGAIGAAYVAGINGGIIRS